MDLYLIRHTRTDTEPGLCYGQTDVLLAESFAEDVRHIHNKLPEPTADCLVISSPLQRCYRLAQTFSVNYLVEQRIQEIHFGAWENRRFDSLDAAQLRYWTDNFVTVAPPNGESFQELCSRVSEFWLELLANKPAKQVFVITHAGVIRALLAHVLALKPEYAFKFSVNPGSVHKLSYSNAYTYIHYLNR